MFEWSGLAALIVAKDTLDVDHSDQDKPRSHQRRRKQQADKSAEKAENDLCRQGQRRRQVHGPALHAFRRSGLLVHAPGEIIPAWVKITRNKFDAEIRFDVEDLPHGVIVDNLGLNGITLLPGQNEGEIQIKAESWVREQDRLCFAIAREAGKQTSLPVVLHVRDKPGSRAKTVTVK